MESQGDKTVSSASELEVGDLALPRERAKQSSAIARSLSKMVSEGLALGAETLLLTLEGGQINCVLLDSAKQQLKIFNLKAHWFEPINSWLKEHTLACFSELDSNAVCSLEWVSALRVVDELLVFDVKRISSAQAKKQLKLSHFRMLPLAKLPEELGVSDSCRPAFNRILAKREGVLVLCAPDADALQKTVETFSAICATNFVATAELRNVRLDLLEVAKSELVILSLVAADVADAVLKLREFGLCDPDLNIVGIVVHGFVRKVCRDCAKETVPDSSLMKDVPEALKPAPHLPYFVGRGCKNCGNTGYRGVLGVQSVLSVESEVRELLASAADQARLVEVFYARGVVPLLEDGLQKVSRGLLTFESLFKLTRNLPQVYVKHINARFHNSNITEPGLSVDEGFFEQANSNTDVKPLSARGAFSGNGADSADDAPLFSMGPGRKLRDKPLLLVVEDDPDQRSILEMVLKSANYDVCTANDGAEAMAAVKKECPDMILSDLMMPNVDGGELVKRLKSDNRFRSIPVLILTVVSDVEKEYALLDLGADDYCEKTIQRKILLKRVENLLKRATK